MSAQNAFAYLAGVLAFPVDKLPWLPPVAESVQAGKTTRIMRVALPFNIISASLQDAGQAMNFIKNSNVRIRASMIADRAYWLAKQVWSCALNQSTDASSSPCSNSIASGQTEQIGGCFGKCPIEVFLLPNE